MCKPLNIYWCVLAKIECTNPEKVLRISPGIVVRLVAVARTIMLEAAVPTDGISY